MRQLERAGKFAESPLTDGISVFVVRLGHLALRRDAQPAVLRVDLHVLLLHARELEARSDGVGLCVFMEVHPTI